MENKTLKGTVQHFSTYYRPHMGGFQVHLRTQTVAIDYKNEEINRTLGIIESSFEYSNDLHTVFYVENLIKEVEEVMSGERDTTGWWYGDGDGTVKVYKEEVELMDAFSSDSGYLPTAEIYELLKDWLEFLKEYYKRSFVPLEWIKEEYLEETKKLQKPING